MPFSRLLCFCTAVFCSFTILAGCSEEGGSAARESGDGPRYTDITSDAGLGGFRHVTGARGDVWFPETMGGGGGFLDYDGDGALDVLLVGGGTWAPDPPVQALWLYRNRGDGTFEDVSNSAGLSDLHAYGMGVMAADYDNDGDQDVYFTTVGENILLRNDGGVFRDVTEEAGVGGEAVWSTAAVFLDGDRDGLLDLVVGNYVVWSPEAEIPCPRETGEKAYCTPEMYEGVASRYYRNRGDGSFEDQSEVAGLAGSPGKTLGMVELDFNGDGWSDVAVANDTEADQLYVNQGDGTFVDRGLLAGIAFDEQGKARAGMGIDAGDVDGDGRTSLFVGNFASEMISVFTYSGDGLFTDRSASSRIGTPSLASLTFGLVLHDADLDGDLDLLAANGHIDPDIERYRDNITFRQRVHLFLNDGSGAFSDLAADASTDDALATPLAARGAAVGDVDGDGDLDVLLTEMGGGVHLWRNETRTADGEGPNYLRVHLEGSADNRDGIGATVTVVTEARRRIARVRSGGSYLSTSEKPLTFGLGEADAADSLIVRWPTGPPRALTDVPGNQTLRVVQP